MQRAGQVLTDQPLLRFLVSFAGIRGRDPNLEGYYKAMAACPSVHIIGDRSALDGARGHLGPPAGSYYLLWGGGGGGWGGTRPVAKGCGLANDPSRCVPPARLPGPRALQGPSEAPHSRAD